MKANTITACVIGLLVSVAVPLSAHHSWPVNMSQLVTVKGTVREVAWGNPHPMFTLEVGTAEGATEKWLVGGPAINRMEAHGWTKTTVKSGDTITGIGYKFADGQKIINHGSLRRPGQEDDVRRRQPDRSDAATARVRVLDPDARSRLQGPCEIKGYAGFGRAPASRCSRRVESLLRALLARRSGSGAGQAW